MIVLLIMVGICLAGVAWIAIRARLMFYFGVRNIPRRRAQSVLIVLGLMLSTLIVSAAFTTGDTLDYSVTKVAYDALGPLDLTANLRGSSRSAGPAPYVDAAFVPQLRDALASDPDVAGVLPALREQAPVVNPRTSLGQPNAVVMGNDAQAIDDIHGLLASKGGQPLSLASLAPDEVLINTTLADKIDARQGDVLQVYFDPQAPVQLRVAGILHSSLLSAASGNFGLGADDPGGLVLPIDTVATLTGHAGQINFLGFTLKGGERGAVKLADRARDRIESVLTADPRFNSIPFVRTYIAAKAAGDRGIGTLVRADKAQAVRQASTIGSVATSIFIVLGLFSIAAGVMLIFLIFVMLAAERKPEMGMMRAIGVRRLGLIQSFVAEGTMYDLLSGAVGAALGILVSFAGIVGGTHLIAGGSVPVYAHVTGRSVVVAYCLGLVLTFATVLISSFRVSRLNISAAIRDLPDIASVGRERFLRARPIRTGAGALICALSAAAFLFGLAGRHQRPATALVYLGCLLGLWGLIWLVRGIGGPWVLTQATLALVLGAVLFVAGRLSRDPFPFQLSVSLLLLGAAQVARFLGGRPRTIYTTAGLALFIYWALPQGASRFLAGNLDGGGPEMFFLSGIMMVTGSTLVLVYNAELLTGMFSLDRNGLARYARAGAGLWLAAAVLALTRIFRSPLGDTVQLLYMVALLCAFAGIVGMLGARFPRFAPALKMAIAYPLASRFRTGMTIAMFSLIIFSLTLISTLNANFAALFASPDAQGGWDIRGSTIPEKPIVDLRGSLRQNNAALDPGKLLAVGRRSADAEEGPRRELRNAGEDDKNWKRYQIVEADDEYLRRNRIKLQAIANGYGDRQAVWDAVAQTPGLAVISANAIRTSGFRDPQSFAINGLTTTEKQFDPVTVQTRDPRTGKTGQVTIIGIVDRGVADSAYSGMVMSAATFEPIFGAVPLPDYFIRLSPGVDAKTAAKQLRAALLTSGFQAESFSELLGKQQQLQLGFNYLLQGFMGLGLLVGIAALGVIAFRSVVERRQQIGMLRALGFQRSTVALSFLLESTFIAILGILAGVVGATLLARNIFHGGTFGVTGAQFFIPWQQVVAFVAAGYVFSLLMTIVPSRGAARIPIAEALRYE